MNKKKLSIIALVCFSIGTVLSAILTISNEEYGIAEQIALYFSGFGTGASITSLVLSRKINSKKRT